MEHWNESSQNGIEPTIPEADSRVTANCAIGLVFRSKDIGIADQKKYRHYCYVIKT